MFRIKYPVAWLFHKNTCRSELDVFTSPFAADMQQPGKEYLLSATISLPEINLPAVNFSELLLKRHSCRRFKNIPVNLQQLSNILFAGYGLIETVHLGNTEFQVRTVPSGGG